MATLIKSLKNILFSLIVIIAILVAISFLQPNHETNGVHNVFGFSILNVLTGSMEPAIKPGDLAIVKSNDPESIEVNDVITFRSSNQTLVTHRVIAVHSDNAEISFETKGDANNVRDDERVSPDQLVGTYMFKIPKFGYLIDFIKTPIGIFLTLFAILSLMIIDPIRKHLKTKEEQKISS